MSKETTSPKPRVIDPAIAALREEHQIKVEAFRKQRKSADTLVRIMELIAKLTVEDLNKLRADLKG